MIAYGIMTLSVSIISAGIRYITDDIVTSRAANGDFQSYLAEANLSESQQIRLGLMADANGGWTTRSGETFDAPPVVFDVQNPAFDFNMVDYASLADHPYGQEQIGAVKSVLKGAVAAELSGPLAFLVNLAGLFSAVFALFLLGSILSQLLWVPLAGAIGRDRTLVTGLLAYGVLLGIYWFVLRSDNLNLIVALPFFLGVCNGCYQNLPWAILPTMIDKANQRRGPTGRGCLQWFLADRSKNRQCLGPDALCDFLDGRRLPAVRDRVSNPVGGGQQQHGNVDVCFASRLFLDCYSAVFDHSKGAASIRLDDGTLHASTSMTYSSQLRLGRPVVGIKVLCSSFARATANRCLADGRSLNARGTMF